MAKYEKYDDFWGFDGDMFEDPWIDDKAFLLKMTAKRGHIKAKAEASIDEEGKEGLHKLGLKAAGEFLAADQGGLFSTWKQTGAGVTEVSAVLRAPEMLVPALEGLEVGMK